MYSHRGIRRIRTAFIIIISFSKTVDLTCSLFRAGVFLRLKSLFVVVRLSCALSFV